MTNPNVDLIQKDSIRLMNELRSGYEPQILKSIKFSIKEAHEIFKRNYFEAIEDLKQKIKASGGTPVELRFKVLSDADENFWEDWGVLAVEVLVPKKP